MLGYMFYFTDNADMSKMISIFVRDGTEVSAAGIPSTSCTVSKVFFSELAGEDFRLNWKSSVTITAVFAGLLITFVMVAKF